MKNPWRKLIDYESLDLVKRTYKRIHGRELSSSAAYDITTLIAQFREYYRNAEESDMSVRPLLQYYGVLSAARALVLLRSRNASLASLKNGHGLTISDWKSVIAKGLSHLDELQIEVQEGSFMELLGATNNHSPLRANSSKVNWGIGYDLPLVGSKITLHELLRSLPDLQQEYKRWMDVDLSYAQISTLKCDEVSEALTISFTAAVSDSLVADLFPIALGAKVTRKSDVEILCEKGFVPSFEQFNEGPFGIGDAYAVVPFKSGVHLCTIGKFFALSYLLSMLVRYFPSTWVSLGRSETGDAIYPIISRVSDLIQQEFPRILLDSIELAESKAKKTESAQSV